MHKSAEDREYNKFRDGQGGEVVAVTIDQGVLSGVSYDDIQVTYPNSTTENYLYYLSASLQATVQVTYTSASKSDLLRVRRI